MVNSGPFTGLPADEAYAAIVASLEPSAASATRRCTTGCATG